MNSSQGRKQVGRGKKNQEHNARPSSGFRTQSREEITANENTKGSIGTGYVSENPYWNVSSDRKIVYSGFRIDHNGQQLPPVVLLDYRSLRSVIILMKLWAYVIQQSFRPKSFKTYMIKVGDLKLGPLSKGWKISRRSMPFNCYDMYRVGEVAEVGMMSGMEVHGSIRSQELTRETTYGAYFVYYLPDNDDVKGFAIADPPLEVVVKICGSKRQRYVCLDPQNQCQDSLPPRLRRDGWMEIEMGDFYNGYSGNAKVETSVKQKEDDIMSGLFIQGIEFRPKECSI
ncbi:hypothetical protein GIB67_029162 [Kingdonia uniflora]|uniref:Uncharacterized protein n=1 Tax=Kingdonia uniflora TaxID=39325 RepID=A0A7J7MEU7_9MAGN|nr:hypothetical protein GIB67_029162 [Kingdonia uniflora]